jgi:2-oxoglutarate dehydrogenase E1 component
VRLIFCRPLKIQDKNNQLSSVKLIKRLSLHMELPIALNAEFIDSQYRLWKSDPGAISHEWRFFFEGFELASLPEGEAGIFDKTQILRQSRVEELIYRYRDIGHLLACLDPLVSCPTSHPLLSLDAFGLSGEDLDRTFYTPQLPQMEQATLREILQLLRETYCRSVGVEYMHLQDPDERRWLQLRMEPARNRPELGNEMRERIIRILCEAALFEQFLNNRYIGQKRFSIEGAETILAMLETLLLHAAGQGCREIILGMAHRGRLNVQVNILKKPYEHVFCEFEDNYNPESLVGSGDVKYHRGYMTEVQIDHDKSMRILLLNNPSHLESVDPVVEGVARARQDRLQDQDGSIVLPLLIHGDAGFSGEGIVYETLNLSQLEGYRTGGTIHIIINNQIGFTTLPEDARSTRYSTDVAKMLLVPIFHVHGEDPEAAEHVMKLALDYRRQFRKDVVIDLVCYRRYGHNEGDEPYFTQPQMYERIKNRPSILQLYSENLLDKKALLQDHLEDIKQEISKSLEDAYNAAKEKTCELPPVSFYESWQGVGWTYSHEPLETGVPEGKLISLAHKMTSYPEGFTVFRKLDRILQKRREAIEKGEQIDWASAEMLAFASLLVEGVLVRLSGQDSRRGTFSQRHSELVDVKTGERVIPLNLLENGQAPFLVYDSMLSENAVLGFEYGYSLIDPHMLVMWEAQFGDFANNAQNIIDQFIAGAESKWQRRSGLVLLLPHGFEGQGPEHSSARLERFLQLCAEDNMQVANPTTPAQHFHLLRRQVKRSFRKPLIVMTPKSLLRHPLAVSKLRDMTTGCFHEVLDDIQQIQNPRRVLLCSGKIYYDLIERRERVAKPEIAILRLEQLYPFPSEQIKKVASNYAAAEQWLWVQEEPENMGGWRFVQPYLHSLLRREVKYLGRKAAASPATGYFTIHKQEQEEILNRAVGKVGEDNRSNVQE